MRKITIDCAAFHSAAEFHAYIRDLMSFPAYYGANLDALHDCLTELSEDTEVDMVDSIGIPGEMRYLICKIVSVFSRAAVENPHLTFHVLDVR